MDKLTMLSAGLTVGGSPRRGAEDAWIQPQCVRHAVKRLILVEIFL
jgi:hypothetical protein